MQGYPAKISVKRKSRAACFSERLCKQENRTNKTEMKEETAEKFLNLEHFIDHLLIQHTTDQHHHANFHRLELIFFSRSLELIR